MAMPEITHATLDAKLEANGAMLNRLLQEMSHHKQLIEGAFPLDDRGLPDYGRHKAQHLAITKSDESMGEYKRAITMRLLQGAVGLLITILGFGLGPYFSKIFGG